MDDQIRTVHISVKVASFGWLVGVKGMIFFGWWVRSSHVQCKRWEMDHVNVRKS